MKSLMLKPIIIACVLIAHIAHAKDFGKYGELGPIAEPDMIDSIKGKLHALEKEGKIDEHNQAIGKRALSSIMDPKPLDYITPASKITEFSFDPSFVLDRDVLDVDGKTIYQKGRRVNPLEHLTMTEKLVFIDARYANQLAFVKSLNPHTHKFILTAGSPIRLGREHKIRFYFDQNGSLTEKLAITHTPAVVWQEGKLLKIRQGL